MERQIWIEKDEYQTACEITSTRLFFTGLQSSHSQSTESAVALTSNAVTRQRTGSHRASGGLLQASNEPSDGALARRLLSGMQAVYGVTNAFFVAGHTSP